MGNEILFYDYDYDGCNFKGINCYKRYIKKSIILGRAVLWQFGSNMRKARVGVFFVHLASAHLQARNIAWSLVLM